jgi:hypothetical protein
MEHAFTPTIVRLLTTAFGPHAAAIFQASPLLQYLNLKTRAAQRGSKARAALANHYALYVLIEDYLAHEFDRNGNYANYPGARYTDLLLRQRELPFGRKLQNHALNSRLNEEFKKYFPTCLLIPIIREPAGTRYWINETLLMVELAEQRFHLGRVILNIIDAFVAQRQHSLHQFMDTCTRLAQLEPTDTPAIQAFLTSLLQPEVDARLFEIVSFGILKHYYADQVIHWGWSRSELFTEALQLFKTGRTNANDGGIDFVLKPTGRFFQVTETTDVRKYFLDIDKVQRFPLTFVLKSRLSVAELRAQMRQHALATYSVATIVERYMACIEEIITVPRLLECLTTLTHADKLGAVLGDIATCCQVEFHYEPSGVDG